MACDMSTTMMNFFIARLNFLMMILISGLSNTPSGSRMAWYRPSNHATYTSIMLIPAATSACLQCGSSTAAPPVVNSVVSVNFTGNIITI